MYKILGTDGKEYGPVTADQIRQWMGENRVNRQTRVLPDGEMEWKALADVPELAGFASPPASPPAAPPAGPPPLPPYRSTPVAPSDQLNGPAIGLIVTAILGFLYQVALLLMNTFGSFMRPRGFEAPDFPSMFAYGAAGSLFSVLAMAGAVIVFLGALKMQKMESYDWALAGSIIALVPCVSPCCLLGLPFGIWALVVLGKPEIKAAFNRGVIP